MVVEEKGFSVVDVVTIIALFAGPAIAVLLQKWRDSEGQARDRKLWVFKTLMATRGTLLSPTHVEALNRIELEFASNSKVDRDVREMWKSYLDVLNQDKIAPDLWAAQRIGAIVDLLYCMGKSLGYSLDKVTIKNGAYIPRWHGQIEEDQAAIRHAARLLLEGKSPLAVELRDRPAPDMPRFAGGGPSTPAR